MMSRCLDKQLLGITMSIMEEITRKWKMEKEMNTTFRIV